MKHRAYGYATGAALFLSVFFLAGVAASYAEAAQRKYRLAPNVPRESIALPDRLQIPSIQLDADIIDVGITKTGNLDVPPNYVQVGWYRYGPIPGLPGNAVLDGHVDNGGSIPGVFKKLRKVKVGDEILVTLTDGTVAAFIVTDSSVYATEAFPGPSVFLGNSDSVIKLITCHGRYIPSIGTYDHRLIVTAVKKSKA